VIIVFNTKTKRGRTKIKPNRNV